MGPITSAILAQVGTALVGEVIGHFSGPSPAEQAVGQQLGIGGQLIPQLQAQAAGQWTPASQAIEQRLEQEVTRGQQSYAASARRQGIGGTVPARAQLGRMRAAKVPALAGLLGQQQAMAQQQLGGLYTGATQQARQMEMQSKALQRGLSQDIGVIMAGFEERKARGEMDERMQGLEDKLLQAILKLVGPEAGSQYSAPLGPGY